MQALHDVVQADYVRYIGMSSCYAYQCESFTSLDNHPLTKTHLRSRNHAEYGNSLEGQKPLSDCSILDYAISHNLTPFISMQNCYSLVYREEEREMFPTLKVQFF